MGIIVIHVTEYLHHKNVLTHASKHTVWKNINMNETTMTVIPVAVSDIRKLSGNISIRISNIF